MNSHPQRSPNRRDRTRNFDRQHVWPWAWLLALVFSGGAQAIEAFVGGEVRLEHDSGNTWRIKASVYEECAVSPLGTPQSSVNALVPGSGFVSLGLQSNVDVTPLCPGQTSACSVAGGSASGIRELVYEGSVTISSPAPGSLLQVFLGGSPRRSTLTTITDPGSTGWLLGAEVAPAVSPSNSNPVFSNPAFAISEAGKAVSIAPNASDPDGDALQYELIDCFESLSSTVPYAPGFDGQLPLATVSGVALNTSTGITSFTPSAPQTAQICVRAIEFRSGVQVGRTVRDIGYRAVLTGNQVPVIAPISNAVATVGEEICRTAVASDADGDHLVLSASGQPLTSGNASFLDIANSPGSAEGEFCYTPVAADAGNTYNVSISATDNACPNPGVAVATFNVTVPVLAATPVEVPVVGLPALILLFLGVVFGGLFSFRGFRRR